MALQLLNETTLEQLKELSSTPNSLLIEVIQLFSDLVPKSFLDMQLACDQANWKTLAFLAHNLKSSSGNVGAHAVFLTCASIEAASLAEDAAICRREMSALYPIIVDTLQALEDLRVSLDEQTSVESA